MFAINRDVQIAAQRKLLHERSQTLANLPKGTVPHARTLAEVEGISNEIERLKGCADVSPALLTAIPIVLFVLVLALIS
ncbi:hypothetical protein ACIA8O_38815 [Kitasatospora sp. NPDC051853]|uniref:hypothetical protein n=1 Tax=Kitasatospora sp. NPDC051853 TaxID=3364058 RepID=UPI0037ACC8E4